jgi:hypothetical protein
MKGKVLAQDDNSGGNRNARILFTVPANDIYTIVATTAGADQFGEFTLTVTELTEP